MVQSSRARGVLGISLVEVTFAITALGSGGFWFGAARIQTQATDAHPAAIEIAREQTELAAVLRWQSRAAVEEFAPLELLPGFFPGDLAPFPAKNAPGGGDELEIRADPPTRWQRPPAGR